MGHAERRNALKILYTMPSFLVLAAVLSFSYIERPARLRPRELGIFIVLLQLPAVFTLPNTTICVVLNIFLASALALNFNRIGIASVAVAGCGFMLATGFALCGWRGRRQGSMLAFSALGFGVLALVFGFAELELAVWETVWEEENAEMLFCEISSFLVGFVGLACLFQNDYVMVVGFLYFSLLEVTPFDSWLVGGAQVLLLGLLAIAVLDRGAMTK
ncbi:Transmembrane domain-containing protein [Spironucleus salmonicida]|uniref:Transmembrane domain-containing protein n=1 Tax=Spironucleus salmonicida TaxID=348837 RepID=V6LDB7_9EUKA|nr:Transmembrane domain-containing protein [Spironucleus salmonicida]|eukprot:EST42500.1 Transmembrane domain-containing protein [Spironucleus salmonicida]